MSQHSIHFDCKNGLSQDADLSCSRAADCTQTNVREQDSCLDSALSVFLATFEGEDTTSFDYGGIASQINSLQSGLTSYGVTLTSFLPAGHQIPAHLWNL